MNILSEVGIFLQNVAHDYKNQLGILETILKDAKDGYEIDEESFDDSFLALRNFAYLSHVLQLGGMMYENLQSTDRVSGESIEPVLSYMLKLLSKICSGSAYVQDDGLKKELQLELYDSHSKKKVTCREYISIPFAQSVIDSVFPSPQAGTSSSQRATYHLIKLLQSHTELKHCIFTVNEFDKPAITLKIEVS